MLTRLTRYLRTLSTGRLILWCYFIWYLVVAVRYFDPSPRLWLTAAGLSVIIGSALWINTAFSGSRRMRMERWPLIRLYLFPFCVSSFSSLVKGRGFILIFSPQWREMVLAAGLCAAFCIAAAIAKRTAPRTAAEPVSATA